MRDSIAVAPGEHVRRAPDSSSSLEVSARKPRRAEVHAEDRDRALADARAPRRAACRRRRARPADRRLPRSSNALGGLALPARSLRVERNAHAALAQPLLELADDVGRAAAARASRRSRPREPASAADDITRCYVRAHAPASRSSCFPSRRRARGADPRAPLAERMRPRDRSTRWSDRIGCSRPGAALRSLVEPGELPSLILWGPPGSGKTTLARLLARGAALRARSPR